MPVEVFEAESFPFVFLLTCTFHTIGLVIMGLIMVSAICSVSSFLKLVVDLKLITDYFGFISVHEGFYMPVCF